MMPETLLSIMVATELYRENAERLIIFHVTDGRHMRASLHYVGAAWDFSRPKRRVRETIAELRRRLGRDYDVVLDSDHVHVEFQPKTGVNLHGSRVERKATS